MGLHRTPGDGGQLLPGRQSIQFNPNTPSTPTSTNRPLQHFDAISPKIGFVYRTTPTSQLYFNASRAYEAPLNLELLSSVNANGTPNTGFLNLDAQRAWQLELGHRGTSTDRRYNWDVTVYNLEMQKEILTSIINNQGDVSPENDSITKLACDGDFGGLVRKEWPLTLSKFSEEQLIYTLRQADSAPQPPLPTTRPRRAHLETAGGGPLARHARALGGPARNSLRPAHRRELAQWVHETFPVSCLRACRLAQFGRAAWHRRSRAKDQTALRLRIRVLAQARPRLGYMRIWVLLRREGWLINRKRVRRLYRLDGFQLRMRVGAGNTSPCSVVRPRSRPGRPSAGAWILCMRPWRTGDRFGS